MTRDDPEMAALLRGLKAVRVYTYEVDGDVVKMPVPGKIRGMAVIAQDDEDLTLVNVIGDIRPENFGAIMAELDVDVPTMSVSMHGPLRALLD